MASLGGDNGGNTTKVIKEGLVATSVADIANFGILTREAKGSELTHEEMDRNITIALDVKIFDG